MKTLQDTYNYIKQELEAYGLQKTKNLEECIYKIKELYISGEYECGYRGVDHNILLDNAKGFDIETIATHGTIIVPETSSYISDVIDPELEALEYTRIPLKEY